MNEINNESKNHEPNKAEEKKKVLLVEDNIVNQKVAVLLLQQFGLVVDVAENGLRALQSVQNDSYDVILMDCQMPEMDGFEATKAIRRFETSQNKYTPIIAVTALAMVGDQERCIAVGMDDYISKPIDRYVLNIKLNHWLRKEFVLRNQELARKYAQPAGAQADSEYDPVNLMELRDYYGEDLNDVMKTFVESANNYVLSITQSISEHDHESLARYAHELKGSSASVGAKQMAKLALYLERAAGLRDWKEAKDTTEALINSFDSVRAFLEKSPNLSSEAVILPIRD
jgi:two-component system sensor histidine kinase/response regulator